MTDFFRRGLLSGDLDVARLFTNFKNSDKNLRNRINHLVIFSQGSIHYEDAWLMSEEEIAEAEDLVAQLIKLTRPTLL